MIVGIFCIKNSYLKAFRQRNRFDPFSFFNYGKVTSPDFYDKRTSKLANVISILTACRP
jgi:hypothetical protein